MCGAVGTFGCDVFETLVLIAALSSSPLFASGEPLPLQLDAPFNDLFEHARNDDYAVSGTLRIPVDGRLVAIDGVKITLRGHTSKRESECDFPKLKVDFPKESRPTTGLFAGLSSIKIGTHCGEADADHLTPRFGRLANERSPFREAFVYRLLAALEVPTLEARPARITYRYTDARPGQSPLQDQPVVRDAVLLEGTDEAVRRVGGQRAIDENEFTTAQAQLRTADTVRLAFAEAMIGNFDWCLKMTPSDAYRCDARHPLWNIVAADLGDGRAIPLLYDFDVAGIVTGRHPWFRDVFSTAFGSGGTEPAIEVMAQLQRTRGLFTRRDLNGARAHFTQRKPQAYQLLATAPLDAAGRAIARQYLDSFYAQIESDDHFYRPVVLATDVQAHSAADGRPICGNLAVIPVGTPVGNPMQTVGTRVQVMLLDAHWRWASRPACAAVRRGPVWIDASAIGRDFPAR
jgi:hypothetical protein